ncbi:hypothetical protein BKA70DRAFT_1124016 [Coprinopsis sp. MPI-PUGE-AT-0042]|nr:hypothetical protein BKA70DRAFT_1124016 [Coprinopsis sp. MPI-PUGE-AT-0042]
MAPSATKLNGVNGHTNGTSEEDFHTLTRHPTYYIQSADLFFLVQNIQFRVHRFFFERESALYRAKLSAPASPGSSKRGSSDNEPIVLTDVSPSDFEKFLWVFYNPHFSLYPAPASTWTSILALAHKWGFSEVKDFCVRELEQKTIEELGDIDRIVVYHANEVDRNLLIPVYAALCAREQPLTLPEGLKLGMETTLVIASAREYVRSQVLEDGSRTPITPTVEGEEMEKIIRDFFGIPIPEGSSASADEVLAAVAMAEPVDTIQEEKQQPEGKPKKVKTRKDKVESSGAADMGESAETVKQEELQQKQQPEVTPKLKVKTKKDKDESSGAPVTSFFIALSLFY